MSGIDQFYSQVMTQAPGGGGTGAAKPSGGGLSDFYNSVMGTDSKQNAPGSGTQSGEEASGKSTGTTPENGLTLGEAWDQQQDAHKAEVEQQQQDTQARLEEMRGYDRAALQQELDNIIQNSGWVTDPDEANRQAERSAEIRRILREPETGSSGTVAEQPENNGTDSAAPGSLQLGSAATASMTDAGTEARQQPWTQAATEPGAGMTEEERETVKAGLKEEEARLQQEYWDLNQRVMWGRIGQDYSEEDVTRLAELEEQINQNRTELRSAQRPVNYGSVLGLNAVSGFERAGLGVTKMLDWLLGEESIPWGLLTETGTLVGLDLSGKNPVTALKRQGEAEVQGWRERAAASAQGNDVAEMIAQHTQSISESLPFVVLNLMSMGTAGMATAAGQTAGLEYTAAINSSSGTQRTRRQPRYRSGRLRWTRESGTARSTTISSTAISPRKKPSTCT